MPFIKWSVERILYSLKLRVPFVNNEYLYVSRMNSVLKAKKGDIYFSIGGDNYCYSNWKYLAHYNKVLNQKKVKTVLWGCSVSPDDINEQMREDLKRYALIIARESITYNALKEINKNIILNPDPAFYMQTEVVTLPKEFLVGNTIGINLSPMIMGYENNANITFKNYLNLVDYILENTEHNVALIPHVFWEDTDDRKVLRRLYHLYKDTGRVCIIEMGNAMQIKWCISQCRMFVGARTHATIAAYSMKIPTLVIGYSVKARGIAKDLFGTYENYVIQVQNLQDDDEILRGYIWLEKHYKDIKEHLNTYIPIYKNEGVKIKKVIETLENFDNKQ